MFIARYDSSGNVTWAKRAGENNADNGVVITVDASDNCYVSGYFMSDSIRFDNTTLINNNNDSTNEIFIVKYDTAGNALWAKSGAGDGIDNVGCIAADANGNIYMTGYFSGDTITFGNTALINTDPGTADLFIAGFDSAGNALWAERAGGNGTDVGIGIGTDVGGSGYVAGWYLGDSALFGSSVLTNTAAGYADMFLAKFDFTTGIEKAIDKNNISAFPNPSTGLINISFGRMISHGDITVLNLTGQIIFRENIFNESGKEINLENISSGIYFVKVFDGINYYCRKLIVEHD
jgi:hypothetical protein